MIHGFLADKAVRFFFGNMLLLHQKDFGLADHFDFFHLVLELLHLLDVLFHTLLRGKKEADSLGNIIRCQRL